MDSERIALARSCLDGAYEGTLDFPNIVGALTQAAFDGYAVDYRRNTTTYFLRDGDSVAFENPAPKEPVAEAFDQPGVAHQIRWAQANRPDYSYKTFCRNVAAMGCAGYLVSLSGRRVLYVGRSAETHVEPFA